jgi:hypothetical protein
MLEHQQAAEKVYAGRESNASGAKGRSILNHLWPRRSRALVQDRGFPQPEKSSPAENHVKPSTYKVNTQYLRKISYNK